MLETFDLPQMNPACQERPTSTVAQQSLYLMNNAAIRSLADDLATRVLQAKTNVAEQIQYAYLVTLGRRPSAQEHKAGLTALVELEKGWVKHLQEQGKKTDEAARNAMVVYCHTLMNSAEFIFVD